MTAPFGCPVTRFSKVGDLKCVNNAEHNRVEMKITPNVKRKIPSLESI